MTIAKALYQISDRIGSSRREVRVYANEIDSFSKLLNQVKTELDKPTSVSADLQSLIKDVVDICNRALTPLDKLQNTLTPLLVHFHDSPRKFRQFGSRLRWVFTSKSKLLFYHDALRSQHGILNTTLKLMIY